MFTTTVFTCLWRWFGYQIIDDSFRQHNQLPVYGSVMHAQRRICCIIHLLLWDLLSKDGIGNGELAPLLVFTGKGCGKRSDLKVSAQDS